MIFGKKNKTWQKVKYQVGDKIIWWTLAAIVTFTVVVFLIFLL
jgi:hypothetical protein